MQTPVWTKMLENRKEMTAEAWAQLSLIARWGYFANQSTLTMTLIPVVLVGLLAWGEGSFSWLKWLAVAVGLLFAHAFNNQINDFVDFERGVDNDDYIKEHVQQPPTMHGWMTRREALVHMAVSGVIALAAGIYLVLTSGPLAVWLLVLGIVLDIFYVYPIKVVGLGELSIAVVWGPLMVGGGLYVLSGSWYWAAALFGLAYSLTVTEVLLGRHLDKHAHDRRKKIFTLPVLLGERTTRALLAVLVVLQYIIIIGLVLSGYFSPAMLIVFVAAPLTVPMLAQTYLKPKPQPLPAGMPEAAAHMWYIAPALLHNMIFGAVLVIALLVETLIKVF